MYYKVLKDNRVIDVLDDLIYLKWDSKHKIMLLCDENEGQAILASDKKTVWHVEGFYELPIDGYDCVTLENIDKYEFEKLRMLNLSTPEKIVDEVVLYLINNGII